MKSYHLRIQNTALIVVLFSLTLAIDEGWAASSKLKATLQCDESSGPILADNSPSKEYFQKLLMTGVNASLDDFMKLWYPYKEQAPDTESHLENCLQQGFCVHDTVYSWGPPAKLKTIQSTLPDGGTWKGHPNPGRHLYTVFSAIGSSSYGSTPLRIKLKSGVKIPPAGQAIIGGDEIESWSFGTPEHYDEIVRDYLRFKSGKYWIGYWRGGSKGEKDKLFLDDPQFNEQALKMSLLEMIRMILNGEGRIYYSRGTCRNRQLEFETRFPTYINPFLAPNLGSIKNKWW